MSQEDVEAGRSVEERVLLWLPTPLVRLVMRGLARMPPGSHLRRRMLKRGITRGMEAGARGDYAIPLRFYEPDVELRNPGQAARGLGLPERYEGEQGFLAVWRDWTEDLDDFRVQPEQIIDLGDRVVLRAAIAGRGRGSGVPISRTTGIIYYFSPRGLVERQDLYWTWEEALDALSDHGEALRAAGLGE
jgi:ketosteroid isomerase-like protein